MILKGKTKGKTINNYQNILILHPDWVISLSRHIRKLKKRYAYLVNRKPRKFSDLAQGVA